MNTRFRHVVTGCAVAFVLFVAFLLWSGRSDVSGRLLDTISGPLEQHPPNQDEISESEFYDWHTRSQFRPVSQAIEHKSAQDLCNAFPKHLLRDIQPVLKTGHAVMGTRVKPHLQSVSACLDDFLLIFSDVDEDFQGYEVIDVIADQRPGFIQGNDQLLDYLAQREMAENRTLMPGSDPRIKGWELDKFKFLPQVSRAWRMRPEKRWYVFFEDDTYIVWDNIFRLLTNFDADMPWYFGSPSPGAEGSWMANGGPGYVLSREAVRRLVKHDFDDKGAFVGSNLSKRWENQTMIDCCGDSILGWALHQDAKTNVSGLWPMFQPHPLHGIPFDDSYWCQPVISMHHVHTEDMIGLRRWEEGRRDSRRPLLFADLPGYLNLTTGPTKREDWINSDWGGYPAPSNSDAHESFDACGRACKADANCFQWTYHLRSCDLTRTFRLGQAKAPEIEEWRSDEEKAYPWTHEEKRFHAGWDVEGIETWIKSRHCTAIQWVKPSVERIF